jgi:UDP-glucose 4-epimerase
MTVFGDGTQTRAFSYIGDVAPVIASAADTPAAYNQVFNIGADQAYSVNELAAAVARAMGTNAHIVHLEPRNEVQHAYSSHEKVRSVFGERSLHSLDEGLRFMALWVRSHGARTSRRFDGIEIMCNLPPVWLE